MNKNVLSRLLTTNVAPNPTELAVVHDALDSAYARVKALEVKFSRAAESELRSIQKEHESASEEVTALKSIVHPVRLVADDIISEIFQWCVPWAFDDGYELSSFGPYDSRAPQHPPWNLSHVCRHWRAVVISLPCLWNTVRLGHTSFPCRSNNHQLKLMLQRSKALSLRVAICGGNGANFPRGLFELLLAAASRWRCARIEGTKPYFSRMSSVQFPELTCISFACAKPFSALTMQAPRLRQMELFISGRPPRSWTSHKFNPPWAQIIVLRCNIDTLHHAFRLKMLKSLTVVNPMPSYIDPDPVGHIWLPTGDIYDHPSVQELTIDQFGFMRTTIEIVFRTFNFLCLHTLTLNDWSRQSIGVIPPLPPTITTFNLLRARKWEDGNFCSLMKAMPNLRTLRLDVKDNIIGHLHALSAHLSLVPGLEELLIYPPTPEWFIALMFGLESLFEERCGNLKRVCFLSGTTGHSRQLQTRLKQFVGEKWGPATRNDPLFFARRVKHLAVNLHPFPLTPAITASLRIVLSACTGISSLDLRIHTGTLVPVFPPAYPRHIMLKYLTLPKLPSADIGLLPPSLEHLSFTLQRGSLGASECVWTALYAQCPRLKTILIEMPFDDFPFVDVVEVAKAVLHVPSSSLAHVLIRYDAKLGKEGRPFLEELKCLTGEDERLTIASFAGAVYDREVGYGMGDAMALVNCTKKYAS
ncbi:hypothetical protein CYLTODRAFT_487901 [Cylindrobasidium torrendii FP15055 ss-10]|uniref:F-box domain-containing protein n=1 Tax=Cylindrobasidium torrendii FP15055 ss-10 TaxID=1314674 RepID=A0A0D7BJ82_9AGAR|nr:hypothetical protein CYLTODRAFT_487901 [Cylindrobasidium torrendii FP15055 ss-10]